MKKKLHNGREHENGSSLRNKSKMGKICEFLSDMENNKRKKLVGIASKMQSARMYCNCKRAERQPADENFIAFPNSNEIWLALFTVLRTLKYEL